LTAGPPIPVDQERTADVLVAELRQVIADLRRGQDDLRQERDHWRAVQNLHYEVKQRNCQMF
jgi:hypothetical protein